VEAFVPPELIVRSGIVGTELVIVGWSTRRGTMQGRQYIKRGDMEAFTATDCAFHISPWNESMQGIKTEPQAVERLARAQVRWMRETFPGAACGGKLLMAHVTRKGITTTIKASLPVEATA
jgi:hypothetical protein